MENINSSRRSLLRLSGVGLAISSVPVLAFATKDGNKPLRPVQWYQFDVRHYGATGDGKTVDTQAINKEIDAAAAAGGGTVFFPAGTYMCFSIRLKDHIHLYLDEGSCIVAADSPLPTQTTGYHGGTYDAAEPNMPWEQYQDYGHNHWHNSLIWGENVHDISITGPGLIYGKGLSNGEMTGRGGYLGFDQRQPGVADKAIAMKNCYNVILRDFSILKGGHFGVLLTGVDNVTIDNLTIDTERDGIDIDCCQNVRVTNCTVNSPWDDGICLKSSYALGYRRLTKNVTITSCFMTGGYVLGTVVNGSWRGWPPDAGVPYNGRIKCGTESNGGFVNIAIMNCICEESKGLALETVDGALLEDISICNLTMRNLHCEPLFLRLGARLRGPKATTQVGELRRVLISNMECYGAPAKCSSIFSGIPGHEIKDVKLSNIYIETQGGGESSRVAEPAEIISEYPSSYMFGETPAYGFFIRHLRNLEMSHVELATRRPDFRPAIYMNDVERADFFAITAPVRPSVCFSLHNVRDFRVGWSRAAPDKNLENSGDTEL